METESKCPCCGDNFDTVASQLLPVWSDKHDNIVCVTCKETTPTIWEAPCMTCGKVSMTDQWIGDSPYWCGGCAECGGDIAWFAWQVSDEPHPALYQ